MATPTNVLAFCVLKYLYEQASERLELLKQLLLSLIMYIDSQIVKLKAILAAYDYLAKGEQIGYDWVVEQTQKIKEALLSFPGGPLAEFCPEFYAYFVDPAIGLLDATLSVYSNVRDRYKGLISYMNDVEILLQYWERTKTDLVHLIDVIDDAIRYALLREAAPAFP